MFGRIRASSSSSSLERPPSKILKDDSLSIYESTLMKLKLGSQRSLNSPSNEAGEIDTEESESMQMEANCPSSTKSSQEGLEFVSSPNEEEVMAVDTDCYSPRTKPCYTGCHSMGSSKQHHKRTISVLYLFSKFRNAQNANSSSSVDSIEIEKDYLVSVSPSFGSCSSHSTEQQFEREFVSSLSVGNM
ncbi:uncharacterized protein LOC107418204 isoform X1 [Ziziphus jujuba]|uniref:Uncharacterized protein LOC107418204 isoform X1 n=2 Tax=Ziziphus jujuba TaxID=326968 RepID=A0A6P4A2W3_ZIZJJ|nr:uncharacterized protein LOC107418204 isoform X1 [Ziziphus jujuba]KAH7528273.1 hypothetical protein FEM48_Zijuj05G0055000 [Ziziphus jujuba var. spinosa]